jgi:ParB family chromosome partitioning protein
MNKDKEKSFKNIKEVSLAELKPFDGHPYKVRDDEEMDALIESIREHGIMVPLMVRPIDTGYEIISGHRRAHAERLAGLESVPAIEVDLSRDEAAVALVESNLHREHILPSEKAFAYKLKLDALSRQGNRTDLTCGQNGHKSRDAVDAEKSGRQIQRYIRLTKLIPHLLDLVDSKRIAFSVGVELSYLNEHLQQELAFLISLNDCTPSYSQANRMHKMMNEGTLDEDALYAIMREEKPNQRERVSISMEELLNYLPNGTPREMQDMLRKALKHYGDFIRKSHEQER